MTERATYDAAGRLLEIANTETGGTLSRFTYGLDAAGIRVELTTTLGTTYYGYDQVNRLASVCTSGSCVPAGGAPLPCIACTAGTISRPAASITPNPSDTFTNYTYDPVGNRTSMTTYLGTTSYSYDAADRLTSSSGPAAATYTYDANGNELSAGSTTYAYDLANRLTSATVGSVTQTYTYSGDGSRLSASTGSGSAAVAYLVDRNQGLPSVAIERDGNGLIIRRSLYGVGRLAIESGTGVPTYEHVDALGSVTDLTSPSGASLAWSEYGAYGSVRSAGVAAGAPNDPFGYSGQYLDSTTSLYYLRARQYDPSTGRLLSSDPMAPSLRDPYTCAYVYAGDNPILFSDPSGKCTDLVVAGAEAGAEVGAGGGEVVEPAGGGILGFFGGGAIGFTLGVVATLASCVAFPIPSTKDPSRPEIVNERKPTPPQEPPGQDPLNLRNRVGKIIGGAALGSLLVGLAFGVNETGDPTFSFK